MTIGVCAALIVPSSGNRHLEVGQHLQQIGLERLVGPVELVDQQDGRPFGMRAERLQQRAADQEAFVEDVGGKLAAVVHALRLGEPDLDHLAGVVPLVDRRGDVEALVALQPDQRPLQRRGQHLGDFGLADAGLAFAEQRAAELQRKIEDRGEAAVGDIVAALQKLEGGVDGCRRGGGHETPGKRGAV